MYAAADEARTAEREAAPRTPILTQTRDVDQRPDPMQVAAADALAGRRPADEIIPPDIPAATEPPRRRRRRGRSRDRGIGD
jgi:hypothetical protein